MKARHEYVTQDSPSSASDDTRVCLKTPIKQNLGALEPAYLQEQDVEAAHGEKFPSSASLFPLLNSEPDHPFNETYQGFNVLFCTEVFILINFMENRNALRQKAFLFTWEISSQETLAHFSGITHKHHKKILSLLICFSLKKCRCTDTSSQDWPLRVFLFYQEIMRRE